MQKAFDMNINATLLGQLILLSFLPPLGLIFVAILALKDDVSTSSKSNV